MAIRRPMPGLPDLTAGLTQEISMTRASAPRTWQIAVLLFALAMSSLGLHAQTYTVLYNFGNVSCDPEFPSNAGIIAQGRDGNLYSTTPGGGCYTNGAAFKMSPSGEMTLLHSFNNGTGDGLMPQSGLTLATNGTFWGTSEGGANFNGGNIFYMTATGTFTSLYSFCAQPNCTDGGDPLAPPVQGMDGNFYGTTADKGNITLCTSGNGGCGVIYKITPSSKYEVIYTFDETNGAIPEDPLLLGTDGNFYGTTFYGGSINGVYNGNGVVFKVTPQGKYTPIYVFCAQQGCLDGGQPTDGLVQGADGNFYGTTTCCGTHLYSNFFGGTIFKLTPAGQYTVLYDFCSQPNCADGGNAIAGLIQGTDGNFYGTTQVGGANGNGTIFQITPEGQYTVLHSFDFTDGNAPEGPLTQGTDGILYGQTYDGGTGPCINTRCGVFFSLDMGLPSYAAPVSWYGQEGSTVEILGQDLNGTTEVSFNGTPATFQVLGNTYLTATVPAAATLGPITVTTPKGQLTSKTAFHVLPHISGFTPPSGPIGTSVTINGSGFTQAVGVGFGNTTPAKFKIVSDIKITATVPTGAKTGPIGVKTKSGTATSSQIFTVTE
jgi:uncharacterized repeat protein (TIGR03803 family)